MNLHFIAIGGAAMHNLALALHKKGHHITGSDDEIFEPSKSRLQRAGILPPTIGWFPEKIHLGLDAIILGMHARIDNPELIRAQELGIPIYSYPEFMYQETSDKIRAVVAGSHGKTTITSMIMHVLKESGRKFDYLVGSLVEGFDTMVGLDQSSTMAVIEGDEYLASPLQPIPKFHLYQPHIALISGIAWDHMNVFPTFDQYKEQFRLFIQTIQPGGILIWCSEDEVLSDTVHAVGRQDIKNITYGLPAHRVANGQTYLILPNATEIPLQVFGNHNLMNLEGARKVCEALGVSSEEFYQAITSFKGAAKRLEVLIKDDKRVVFRDFAHSPSKVKATVQAVQAQFPHHHFACVLELHTFSSLNRNFLKEYVGSMQDAAEAVVYYNPHTIANKRLEPITPDDVKEAFQKPSLRVITDPEELRNFATQLNASKRSVLLMSSGNWGGVDMQEIFLNK
ncbi:MAG: Mur ligase family protein [Flavobacteriales bacterium]|nr:Mur ligase family protein [Flavobacteriales bacterium]